MTNDDLANMEVGLKTLKQVNVRPVLNMMIVYCLNTLKPLSSALRESQLVIRKEYLDLDLSNPGLDPRNKDGSLKMKDGKTEADYDKEMNTLFAYEVEVPLPKFKFRVQDFLESNVAFSPEITQMLGPLVSFEGFEDFVANLQSVPPPAKGAAIHRLP